MRRLLATFGIAALTGAAVLLAAAPAQAHSYLVASTPQEGATLTTLPEEFSVTANETLLDLGGQGVFALQIRDAAGGYYGDGCVDVTDATMSAPAVLGDSGDYTVLWQVVSADGHPVSGEIPFSWEAPADFEPAERHSAAPVCGEDPDTPVTAPTGPADPAAPWIGPITVVLGVLVVVLATVAARRQLRDRTAKTEKPPTDEPSED